jgi:hypothetical protein
MTAVAHGSPLISHHPPSPETATLMNAEVLAPLLHYAAFAD